MIAAASSWPNWRSSHQSLGRPPVRRVVPTTSVPVADARTRRPSDRSRPPRQRMAAAALPPVSSDSGSACAAPGCGRRGTASRSRQSTKRTSIAATVTDRRSAPYERHETTHDHHQQPPRARGRGGRDACGRRSGRSRRPARTASPSRASASVTAVAGPRHALDRRREPGRDRQRCRSPPTPPRCGACSPRCEAAARRPADAVRQRLDAADSRTAASRATRPTTPSRRRCHSSARVGAVIDAAAAAGANQISARASPTATRSASTGRRSPQPSRTRARRLRRSRARRTSPLGRVTADRRGRLGAAARCRWRDKAAADELGVDPDRAAARARSSATVSVTFSVT